ncbi:MAG TPA: hypothetical protein VKA10_12200 [Prolixibacteraceae bacterium]|nr:hypothetical protein [Prolixibacteraceae bacterium]
MDTISTIFVTAFINVFITGFVSSVVFFRYQKRIEETMAKSLFEYETKFSRNHEKKVETLEELFQKYSDFRIKFNRYLFDGEKSIRELKDDKREIAEIQIEDIQSYFRSHRIFIDVDIATKLDTVFNNSSRLFLFAGMLSFLPEDDFSSTASAILHFLIEKSVELKGFDTGADGYPIFDNSVFVNGVIGLVSDYSKTIEKIYRDSAK